MKQIKIYLYIQKRRKRYYKCKLYVYCSLRVLLERLMAWKDIFMERIEFLLSRDF